MHGGGWWSFISFDESKGKPTIDRQLLRRVLKYARPYGVGMFLLLAMIILEALLGLIPPLLYRDLIDNVLPNGDVRRLNILALIMVAIPVTSGLLGVVERYFSSRVGEGIIFDLRQEMYEHLQQMSLRFFTRTKSGEIISRFTNDVVGAQNAITGTLPNIVTNVVVLVTTLGVMISIDWRLTLLSVVVLPLFLLPTKRVGRILRNIRREAMQYNADLSSIVNETLSINGSLLVKIFGRQQQETERFKTTNGLVRDIGVRRALVGRWFFLGLGIAGAVGTALIYWAGGHMVLAGGITIGTIVAFAAYLTRLYGPISSLSNVQVDFVTSLVSFERVFDYLDLAVEIQDRADAVSIQKAEGHLRFEGVSFSYATKEEWQALEQALGEPEAVPVALPEGNPAHSTVSEPGNGKPPLSGMIATRQWALDDVSFEIQPGQLVALVGPSGAGKTTISYLIPRLYDPTVGRILLDGRDLRDMTIASLAEQIGMVTQETYLFHDTIRANLQFARPGATDAELDAAVRAANLDDVMQRLPLGYDTIVGERGYRLSGGEKQRLSIARVILKDPRLLILDEATSHLDSHSEALIQAAFEPLFKGRTSVVIAHRLSTILSADQILVFDQGHLVESGTHAELIGHEGVYAHLYRTQFNQVPEAAAGKILRD
ncbi:MAG: ABC transporter transmembrane domain-containing protein [Anaerolineales bacterium]